MNVPNVRHGGGYFPFVRNPGRCDLCGCKSDALRYVTLSAAARESSTKGFRMERGLWVCGDHDARPPLQDPRKLSPGTTKKRPQSERLF
jgi:hypothetical protein